MFGRHRGSAAALVLILLAAPPASAQDKGLETAKEHFDDGQALYLQGKFGEAAEKFVKAYEAKTYPAFLFNIAVCYEKNRDFAKALGYYERYLKEDPTTNDREVVQKRIKGIRDHLSPAGSSLPSSQPTAPPNLPQIKPKGLVVIESKPEGAAIYLGGDKRKGVFTRTPYTGNLPEGKHTVILEMRKFKPERKTFHSRSDRLVYLYFALSSEEYLGWIEVKANIPGAEVFFDKKEVGAVGRTPYTGFLRPGKRKIIVERPGYAAYVKELEITAGKDHVVAVELTKVKNGWLKVTGATTEGATINVDGKPVTCKEHPCQAELGEGSYKVEIVRKGFKKYLQAVTVKQATETQLAVRLMPKPSRVKAYVTWGVSTAFLIGGIVTGVMSKNHADSLESDLAAGKLYDSADSRLGSGKVTAIIANSLFGLAGLTGALGIYYMFRNEGEDSYGEARMNKIAIVPSLGPNSAGLAGHVRF
jgi:tetratricopeptide (TPR) repeat protein